MDGQEDIRKDLEFDIDNATECDYDDLARYLLSLCLEGERKEQLDTLQVEIEQLQEKHYKGENDDGTKPGEASKPEGVEREKKLVQDRDAILAEYYQQCLEAVLEVANDSDVRALLKEFSDNLLKKEEIPRYKSYVQLCNNVLDRLAKLVDIPLRRRSDLDIRLHHADPKPLKSKFKGMLNALLRKPDCVTTSRKAAESLLPSSCQDEKFSEPPQASFSWPAVLSSHEFKVLNRELTNEATQAVKPGFGFGVGRMVTIPHDELEEYDLTTDGTNQTSFEQPASSEPQSSKPARQDDETDGSAQKKQRVASTSGMSKGSRTVSKSCENSNTKVTPAKTERKSFTPVPGRVQSAMYALEMLSGSVGVHHVINLLLIDEYLCIWYYDRQGIISTNGISFIADFPRVLVLLLAFQRFQLKDWGIIPCLNPDADVALGVESLEVSTPFQQSGSIDTIELNLEAGFSSFHCDDRQLESINIQKAQYLSHRPHCLAGRATAVLEAEGNGMPMACKIYSPEVERPHEGVTLSFLRAIAKEKNIAMLQHLPTPYFYGDLEGWTTGRIRSMLKVSWKGHRAVRIIGLKKLDKLTKLSGELFVCAWLEAVTCHAFLWKHGVEHGDPSLYNIMYDPDKNCGVMTDFDLAVLQFLPRVPGSDSTGTIPFMSIDLLQDEYWDGQVTRYYHHELEAFIWVLPFVFLLYQDQIRHSSRFIDPWITSDYHACRKEKQYFYRPLPLISAGKATQPGFQNWWPLAQKLCNVLRQERGYQDERCHTATLSGLQWDSPDFQLENSRDLWGSFVRTLKAEKNINGSVPFETLIKRLEDCKPTFQDVKPAQQEIIHLRKIYDDIILNLSARAGETGCKYARGTATVT